MPFDPFSDFETAGYLRNAAGEKDLDLVKIAEHQLFRAQLPTALKFLESRKQISYSDFLEVHRILFAGFYPWAGQDRAITFPDRAVLRGDVYFAHPMDCRRAVEVGLTMANIREQMRSRPGHIMGLFAYGHPFLDGNGRTILVIHTELCFRAGLSIDWTRISKTPYLQALTEEIKDPNGGHLDRYLRPYIDAPIARDQWLMSVDQIPGLDGTAGTANSTASYSEPDVAKKYREFEQQRRYDLR